MDKDKYDVGQRAYTPGACTGVLYTLNEIDNTLAWYHETGKTLAREPDCPRRDGCMRYHVGLLGLAGDDSADNRKRVIRKAAQQQRQNPYPTCFFAHPEISGSEVPLVRNDLPFPTRRALRSLIALGMGDDDDTDRHNQTRKKP